MSHMCKCMRAKAGVLRFLSRFSGCQCQKGPKCKSFRGLDGAHPSAVPSPAVAGRPAAARAAAPAAALAAPPAAAAAPASMEHPVWVPELLARELGDAAEMVSKYSSGDPKYVWVRTRGIALHRFFNLRVLCVGLIA